VLCGVAETGKILIMGGYSGRLLSDAFIVDIAAKTSTQVISESMNTAFECKGQSFLLESDPTSVVVDHLDKLHLVRYSQESKQVQIAYSVPGLLP